MSKNDKLDELFKEWGSSIQLFVDDGFTYPDVYEKQKIKILYILRDPHVEDKSKPASLREDLKHPDGEGKTWNNVGRWTMALLDNEYYKNAENMDSKKLADQIARIGFMNIKKEAGDGKAKDITEHAEYHKEHIIEQITICDPDVIIACGTFGELKTKVFDRKWKRYPRICNNNYRVMPVEVEGKSVPVIEFYHPQYSGKNEELFEDMKSIREYLLGQ